MKFENNVIINRPHHEVYEYLTQLENIPVWNYAIDQVRMTTPGPVRVGSEYRQVRRLPQPSVEKLTIIGLKPNDFLALEGGFGLVSGKLSYHLKRIDQSTTLVVNSADLTASGFTKPLLAIVGGKIKNAVYENLHTLKNVLEEF